MRKKVNNIRLLLVFLVLLVLVVVLFTNKNGHKERSFDKQLIEFDIDDVDLIKIYSKTSQSEPAVLKKDGDSWFVESGDQLFHANLSAVDGIISTMQGISAKSLVANSKERWETYEVNDSLACRVQLFNDSKNLADLYIGKFKFAQPRNMSTYVRLSGKKETYKVDGYLQGIFNLTANDLRDKTIIDDRIANWLSMKFDYPADSSFVLSKSDNKWMLDGVLADSVSVVNYINGIKTLNGSNIVDGNDLDAYDEYQLTIERENLSPIIINAKKSGTNVVLQSTENKEAMYNDASNVEKVFVPKSKFKIN